MAHDIDEMKTMEKTKESYSSFFNAPFLMLVVYNVFFCMSYGMVGPIMMKYLVTKGIEMDVAGVIVGVVSITSLIVRPLSGHLTDHLNQKKLLIVASLLMGIAMVGIASCSRVPALIFFRVCHGIGFAINGTCCIAMATSFMPKDRISEGIGYFGIANIVSTAIAPTFGLECANWIGFINTIYIAGGSVLLASAFLFFFKPSRNGAQGDAKGQLKDALRTISLNSIFSVELLPLALFVAAFSFSNSIVSNYLALICDERGITGYSIYFTVNAVVMIVCRPFLGKLNDRKGLSIILYPAFLLCAAALFLICGAKTIWAILLASVLKALGQGSGQPALQAECIKRLDTNQRGLATSTFYVGSDVANGLGPIIGGMLVTSFGYAKLFEINGFLLIAAFVGYYLYTKSLQRKKEKKEA